MGINVDELISKLQECKEHGIDGRVVPIVMPEREFGEDPWFPATISDIKYGVEEVYIHISYE